MFFWDILEIQIVCPLGHPDVSGLVLSSWFLVLSLTTLCSVQAFRALS